MNLRLLLAIACLPLLAACTPASKFTFEAEVINTATVPISVGMTKQQPGRERPEVEYVWGAPEDIAIHAPQLADRKWGAMLKPGQRIKLGPLTGKFPQGVVAVLRVYSGDKLIDDLLAIRRDDPDRLDLMLWPGRTVYEIRNTGERLTAQRLDHQPLKP